MTCSTTEHAFSLKFWSMKKPWYFSVTTGVGFWLLLSLEQWLPTTKQHFLELVVPFSGARRAIFLVKWYAGFNKTSTLQSFFRSYRKHAIWTEKQFHSACPAQNKVFITNVDCLRTFMFEYLLYKYILVHKTYIVKKCINWQVIHGIYYYHKLWENTNDSTCYI